MREKLRKLVNLNTLEDIYLSGFVDIEDGVAEFYPNMRYLYFSLGDVYIEFQSVEQFSKMKIIITDSVRHEFEIDEDMIPSKASINEVILVDTLADNRIKEMLLYNISSICDNDIICDAVQINLISGQKIFLDPTFYYGIGIGGTLQKEWWENNLSDDMPQFEELVKFNVK
ncbi:hypothetical protein SH2C18_04430 [Clostridium sediminicola]|uniref:hypothetical protein n=1 Tax=Clostridium sediminicola TaxID=3114879 RepID=UPI0031F23154